MLEAVKEIRFIPVKFPIMLITENTGAMFMAENLSSGVRMRHIDNRYHFIREHVEGFIKIVFVKTKQTCSPRMSARIPKRNIL
jgi:hypothetical protein